MPTKHRREAEKMKMAGYTYFPFDVVDWMTSEDVMAMTAAERGVYITLLCVQYRDGFVPSNPQSCSKVSGFRVEMVRRWFAKWSHLFPISDANPSHLRNEKLHEIAVRLGKLAPREGVKEKKEEESKGQDTKGEREESPLPEEKKDKTSGASERKTERQKQNQPPYPSAAPAGPLKKDCHCPDGLCDWTEAIPGCAHPASVGDAVYYQRHIKRNDYFIPKLSRGYVRQQWQRLLNDTPEDFEYDPEPMFKERTVHLDGGETQTVREVVRRPKNAKERALLLRDPDRNRRWLYDPTCPRGCKKGYLFVSDFPDAPFQAQRGLGHDEFCECVTRAEASSLGATA